MGAEPLERKLAAILYADVAGYSRLTGEDEEGTHRLLSAYLDAITDSIERHNGKVLHFAGDAVLADFATVSDALTCAAAVQQDLEHRNQALTDDRKVQFRIGVNLGEVIVDRDEIYGEGVNIAARLESLAKPGGICISEAARSAAGKKLPLDYEFMGEQQVKNIAEPVKAYHAQLKPGAVLPTPGVSPKIRRRRQRLSVVPTVVALLVVGAGVITWLAPWAPTTEPVSEEGTALPLPDKPSIAVLPFTNMSDDPKQEYFVDGMTEDLITDLSKLSGLFVIARNSVFTYKGKPVKVQQVAEELGVRYVLEGSVRRADNQVRINAQLIDATTGGHVWAERYDGSLDDVFALQDQVTQKIVTALAVSLTAEEEAEQARHDTNNAEAHDAYLQGWAHYKLLTPKDLARAIPYFEEAIALDPNYAQAHAALASLYWDAFKNDWAFDLHMPSFRAENRANEHLEEALKAPTPLAYILQSRMFSSMGFPNEAVEEAEKAVALDPNDATALAGFANGLVLAGRPDEGLALIQDAMRLDPHHPPSYLITQGAAEFGMERFKEAAATFERAVKRNPNNELPLIYLAASYGHLGRIKDADDTIEAANDLRDKLGEGDLSLERKSNEWYSPFKGEIDFTRFGRKQAQERVRVGLTEIPALTWQYLVTPLGAYENTWFEVKGATVIDVATAKFFHDRGVVFIDVRPEVQGWIPGAVHLSEPRPVAPSNRRLTETTLMNILDKTDEVVFYCGVLAQHLEQLAEKGPGCHYSPFASAKALTWGYQNVFYFAKGFPGWKEAGYPVEKGG